LAHEIGHSSRTLRHWLARRKTGGAPGCSTLSCDCAGGLGRQLLDLGAALERPPGFTYIPSDEGPKQNPVNSLGWSDGRSLEERKAAVRALEVPGHPARPGIDLPDLENLILVDTAKEADKMWKDIMDRAAKNPYSFADL